MNNYSYNGNQQNTGFNNGYQYTNGQNYNQAPTGGKVGFGEAIKLFFVNYVNFKGRSTKSEYWWAFLFNTLVSAVLSFIPYIGAILTLGLMIPGVAVTVRRLHDIGKDWYYIFISFIPLAGAIILIVDLCKDSVGDNQWGPAPSGCIGGYQNATAYPVYPQNNAIPQYPQNNTAQPYNGIPDFNNGQNNNGNPGFKQTNQNVELKFDDNQIYFDK